jgi:3-hydroxyisobutyrate dehydrogenase-like beta-hydroxyacid dehydrogenase
MGDKVTFIGFGEAGRAFATGWPAATPAAFDIKTGDPATRSAQLAAYDRAGMIGYESAAAALRGASAAFCVVTADQALSAAKHCAPLLASGALWLDMNSVAPDTKREAAAAIEAAGGRYVDVAVMAPVHPAARAVPLLVSGPHADAAEDLLASCGFSNVRKAGAEIGRASAIKMVRSVLVKGLEALTAECILAADMAGVRDEVIASLDSSWRETSWAERADYNLDRMIVHGLRRAAEMDEVVKTLDALGTGSAMSRATAERQRDIGQRHLRSPAGLGAKIETVLASRKDQAA